MTDDELENLIAITKRSRGWNNREYPPQRVALEGGCELIALAPVLWRGFRCNSRPKEPCRLYRMPQKSPASQTPLWEEKRERA